MSFHSNNRKNLGWYFVCLSHFVFLVICSVQQHREALLRLEMHRSLRRSLVLVPVLCLNHPTVVGRPRDICDQFIIDATHLACCVHPHPS